MFALVSVNGGKVSDRLFIFEFFFAQTKTYKHNCSEFESEKSDDPGGGAAPGTTHANMVQVGGATAVAAAMMRERIELMNTQVEEIDTNRIQNSLWRPNTNAANNATTNETTQEATSGKNPSLT